MTDKTSSDTWSFPDQRYINQVRDALWDGAGRASVMIGSGFSKNAEPTRPDAGELPSWGELASDISRELNPPGSDGNQPTGGTASPSSDDFLQLFQDYETHFGRSALHLFLERRVRDGDFSPGELHRRMLQLPWRDVFTTNWDTLLERTRPSVPERGYSVIHNKDEIPLARHPGIVKLHGTLGGHYPLIATKKDYRTYPNEYAPLVNTVQQAMMETVFCLIGFSGDDPNFQEWSRWVKGNLRESAPRIYLAGRLGMTPDERSELLERNVVPIDLARHPQASQWPEHLRHRYATDWLLHTLERGEPYLVADWPSLDARSFPGVPSILEPVDTVTANTPNEEKYPDDSHSVSVDQVRRIIEIWAHNRRLYPGWLAVPHEARWSFLDFTERWETPVLNSLCQMPPLERLNSLRELIWRYEVTLHPLSEEVAVAAEKTLEKIDCSSRTVDGNPDSEVVWAEVREAWCDVALALLTEARYRLDRKLFNRRAEIMSPFLNDHSAVLHRVHHERCLWAIWSADFESLEKELGKWRITDCDPIWMMRKSAILFQCGREREAVGLNGEALEIVRRIPSDDQSVVAASQESWALLTTAAIQRSQRRNSRRWAELVALNCDVDSDRIAIANSLSSSSDAQDPPDFDLGYEHAITIMGIGVSPEVDPYRAVRQAEVAGVPPFVMHGALRIGVFTDILKSAALRLADIQQELAIRLVIQNCASEDDDTLNRVLSRTSVALLPIRTAQKLANDCIKLIEYGLVKGWVTRPRVAMEVLSRLVLRLGPEPALEVFDKTLAYYGSGQDSGGLHPWLSRPLRNLLQRAWDTLPADLRSERVLDTLDAPIMGLDGFRATFNDFPDAGDLLIGDAAPILPERVSENEEQWQHIISPLVRGLKTGGEARRRASCRIVPVANQGRLTKAEKLQVGEALWSEEYVTPNGLPIGTGLHDWALLTLPEPSAGLASERFFGKWLSAKADSLKCGLPGHGPISFGTASTDPSRLEDTLLHLGRAISRSVDVQNPIQLTEEMRQQLIELIESWAIAEVQVDLPPLIRQEVGRYNQYAIQGLKSILVEQDIPEAVAERLFQKVKGLTAVGIPAFDFVGELIRLLPDREDEIVSWLRLGLASNDSVMQWNALVGLDSWIVNCKQPRYKDRHPPIDLVREIGLIIAVRRREALSGALDMARRLFEDGNDVYREAIRHNVLQGLDYLIEELRYDRERSDDNQVPLLRLRCARLASAMSAAGLGHEPVVVRWLDIAENDPLPEVRQALTR